ncbi:LysE family translocator [Marinobacter sp. DY40_1A1]|uniref:LysE family translocator n=1 Tax=Marinobacter sp. DY40_1A1 TaxID=2583229 RepID=UPI00190816E0|nr:LysE family transporter [Marinobacter sp. DY40_1A1]MBK1885597.1 LysE family transporter [Marinobacter sp. DY40_1A1]
MQLELWLIYLITCVGLSLSPGPNGLLALTHGALHGNRKTLFTILGGAAGFTVVIALCMFGIGALIKSSLIWLTILKWIGGIYLVWLGIQVWRSPPIEPTTHIESKAVNGRWLFRQGLLASLTNPKALLFFSAFLPQFIDPDRGLVLQFIVLALTFVVTECFVEYFLATSASRIRHWLRNIGKAFNRVCGGIFIAIGAALPLRT